MKKYALLFSVVFIILFENALFAAQNDVYEHKLPAPFSQTLIGQNIDYRDFLAGLSVKAPLQRTLLNLSLFYEKTKFFYDAGDYGLGVLADVEIGLIEYRASIFAISKISVEREEQDAGLENFETGIKLILARAANDSFSVSTHLSGQVVEKSDTAYVPDNFFNAGLSFSWGVPYVIAFREMLVFGTDFRTFTKYLTRTELEFSRDQLYYFGRTSLILGFEYEFIRMPEEKDKNHFEFSFTLFNVTGLYYTFAWRFGTVDEYIWHNRIGMIIKF